MPALGAVNFRFWQGADLLLFLAYHNHVLFLLLKHLNRSI
jgi:hypothetical protein